MKKVEKLSAVDVEEFIVDGIYFRIDYYINEDGDEYQMVEIRENGEIIRRVLMCDGEIITDSTQNSDGSCCEDCDICDCE